VPPRDTLFPPISAVKTRRAGGKMLVPPRAAGDVHREPLSSGNEGPPRLRAGLFLDFNQFQPYF